MSTIAGVVAVALTGAMSAAAARAADEIPPADSYILAPASRTLAPVAVYRASGDVEHPDAVLSGGATTLRGAGSQLILDFGKEVGGLVTLHFSGSSGGEQRLGLAFSESTTYAGAQSDASNGGGGPDGAIYATVDGAGTYTMPADKLRGGFRYLSLTLASGGSVDLDRVSLHFTASPAMADPSAYPSSFRSSDPLLNRIWYAGAYTVQMDTIAPDTGRVWGPPPSGWENDALVGVGDSVLVDGAKRDRTVWPGDLGVAVPTAFVSTDDTASTRNALTTLYQHQRSDGELPYAGPEVNFYGSDTYHTWTLVGTANYYRYSADKAWLDEIWPHYVAGMNYILGKVDARGLLNVTGTGDWARSDQGGENIEANAILYRALTTGTALARAEGSAALAHAWSEAAAKLKAAANEYLWDAGAGEYRDNPSSGLHPQDGNSLAVWFGLVDSRAKAKSISRALTRNWDSYGATTPEWGGNIGTFPGSMEVQAHFAAGDDETAVDLIRREWGYMLTNPTSTQSTFWEGFNADGSYAYGGSYMSHAHGWATGPTSALTFYLLGVAPESAGAATYHLVPHPARLRFAQGRLATPSGTIHASWRHEGHRFSEHLEAPAGTTGRVGVPTFGRRIVVTVNGRLAWNGRKAKAYGAHAEGGYVYLEGLPGGVYDVKSHPASPPVRELSVDARPAHLDAEGGEPSTVKVTVTGQAPNAARGTLTAEAPDGWTVSPAQRSFRLQGGESPDSQTVAFEVTPPRDASGGPVPVTFTARVGGRRASDSTRVLPFGRWPDGTTATASSYHASNVYQGQVRTYDPGNAIDRDFATFWNDDTPGGYPDVLTVTSPSAVRLDGVAFASIVDGVPVDFAVQTWDGSRWVDAAHVSGNHDLSRWVPFGQPVTTSRLRIVVTRDETQNGEFSRVVEVAP